MKIFTPKELDIMKVLWKHGEMKPAEIQEKFEPPVGNAAVRSVLLILLEKGHVIREKRGKVFYYKPSMKKQSAFKRMINQIADIFCGGSSAELIAQLIKSEKLSDSDIAELKQIAGSPSNPDKRRK